MTPKRIAGSDFEALLAKLPDALDVEATARASGALKRRRGVRSATNLLRLALGYAVCGMSLRDAAAWAEIDEIAEVSDVALLNRLRKAAVWLGKSSARFWRREWDLPGTNGAGVWSTQPPCPVRGAARRIGACM